MQKQPTSILIPALMKKIKNNKNKPVVKNLQVFFKTLE